MWLCAVPEIVRNEVAVLVFVTLKQTRTKVFWFNSLNVLAFLVSRIFNNHTNKTSERPTAPDRKFGSVAERVVAGRLAMNLFLVRIAPSRLFNHTRNP